MVAAALFLALNAGCYHYRVRVPDPAPATEPQRKTVHSLAWGLLKLAAGSSLTCKTATRQRAGSLDGLVPSITVLGNSQWKKQLLEKAASAFTRDSSQETERFQDELLKKIGELTVERDFLARGLPRSR